MEIQYIGEQLIFGKIGNLLVALAFSGALLAAFSYLFAFIRPAEDKAWRSIARTSFLVHSLSVAGIFVLLYYLFFNHRFEYYYIWQHSSTILPHEYIFASFWEGQEGSFLLWAFWHVVLSWFIIRKGGSWEAPVMITIALVQAFLASMVLGIHIGDLKIGSNPFVLLREHPDMANLPFIQMPDYLQRMDDGRGLNPLLQNYWMVIHPPTLFLGFAATLIPFAYAMAGLMRKKINDWTAPALPWSHFALMTLGAGILMGAAWAYEALSFGGFWAWDPVENASLVPWVILAGAVHVMLINKKNGTGLLSAVILVSLTFLTVLYSTFLTRSGILGETSVHAFTDLGMSGQLLLYMGFFTVMAAGLLLSNRKLIHGQSKDDSIYSREFWMFIGMLVLVISAIQITFTTSIPVWNKIFGSNMAPPANVISYYNSWQIPFAIVIAFLTGFGQFMKYRETPPGTFFKKISVSLVVSIVISSIAIWQLEFDRVHYMLLLFAAVFGAVANFDYFIRVLKGNVAYSGGSIAHMGLALILIGALISNGKSQVISKNLLNVDLGKDFPNNENIMLVKNDTMQMANYFITYKGSQKKGVNVFYEIEYLKPDFEKGTFNHAFTLSPTVQLNPRMGNVSEPATMRFFDKDIYTHVTYADLENIDRGETEAGYLEPVTEEVASGDTLTTSNALITFLGLTQEKDRASLGLGPHDIAVRAMLEVTDVNKKKYTLTPLFAVRERTVFSKEEVLEPLGLKISFTKIDPETGKISLAISEKKDNKREFIIMKAIVFPWINILWIGCLLLVLGTFVAIIQRTKEYSRSKKSLEGTE